jgi:hypothetical protein
MLFAAMTHFVEGLTIETLYNNNNSLYATSLFSCMKKFIIWFLNMFQQKLMFLNSDLHLVNSNVLD